MAIIQCPYCGDETDAYLYEGDDSDEENPEEDYFECNECFGCIDISDAIVLQD